MVLSGRNKVDILGRPIQSPSLIDQHQRHDHQRNQDGSQSPTSTASFRSSTSLLSEHDKVRMINDDLLKMIIMNDANNGNDIKNNNNYNHNHNNYNNNRTKHFNDHQNNDHFEDVIKNMTNGFGEPIKSSAAHGFSTTSIHHHSNSDIKFGKKVRDNMVDGQPNKHSTQGINSIVGELDSKKMAPSNQGEKEMSTMLDSNRARMISTYFNYSSIVSHSIRDYFEGNVRGKLGSEDVFYDNVLLYLAYLYCVRNLMLAFIEDIELRAWLGEVERVRPYRQLVMVQTIWSVYLVAVLRNFRPDPSKKHPLSWLEVFRVLRAESTPKSFGLSERMLNAWYEYSVSYWRQYFGFAMSIFLLLSLLSVGLLRHRWNGYDDPSANIWYNAMLLFWTAIQIAWTFLATTHTYVCMVYFISLCYYFRIRYEKVNEDIEIIINKRMKANERVALLHHILVEHNSLCLKVFEYNKFWSSHLMSTYFFLVAAVCFCSFQAFFTANLVIVRLYMFLMALLAGFIITRISVSAAVMSNRAHEPYGRLIRVTFEKYPVELQIQLRMFIQRTSGPTIGFYCLDVFEITYTTYASILAALGQNFLLIVDFVRSYAEVGKEYEEISFSDLNLLTNSVLNSTLDIMDEMTGTHLASTLHSNGSFISF